MDAPEEILSKADFAARSGVSPSAVSHWIRDGKIGPEALVGEGRSARIRVAVAQAQLRTRLDIGQRLGNGLTTRLSAGSAPAAALPAAPAPLGAPTLPLGAPERPASPAAPPAPPALPPSPLRLTEADAIEERIKLERLAALERENRRKAEEEAERLGRYVEAGAARGQMTRIAKVMLGVFEDTLPQFANAVAERFQVPQRDVLHLLTAENRKMRERAADALKRQAEDMPRLLPDESEAAADG